MLFLMGLRVSGIDSTPAAANVEVNKESINFGLITDFVPEKALIGKFQITNKSAVPIFIKQTSASCGCTVSSISSREIPPGETVTLEAKLSLKDIFGKKMVKVVVRFSDDSFRLFTLEANVIPKAQVQPKNPKFTIRGNDTVKPMIVDIFIPVNKNITEKSFVTLDKIPDGYLVESQLSNITNVDDVELLKIHLTMTANKSMFPGIYSELIKISSIGNMKIDIPFSVEVKPEIVLLRDYIFPTSEESDSIKFQLDIISRSKLTLEELKIVSEQLDQIADIKTITESDWGDGYRYVLVCQVKKANVSKKSIVGKVTVKSKSIELPFRVMVRHNYGQTMPNPDPSINP
ncbi:MAG: DUF1573 domain-containing protein [Chthoniobacterales bacterium]|nr:DUF1573 domain-containing protein [Chthoniobacterales bacterium]